MQIGTQSMTVNGSHVSYNTMTKTTSIELEEKLEAGTHRFEFQLIAEANTTYVSFSFVLEFGPS
jgi:hypothetical protein